MVLIDWCIILAVSKYLSCSFSNLKKRMESVISLTLSNGNRNINCKETYTRFMDLWPTLHLWPMDLWPTLDLWRDLFIEDPNFGGPTILLTYHVLLLKQQCLMKLVFMQTGCLLNSPFIFYQIVGLVYQTYVSRRGEATFW